MEEINQYIISNEIYNESYMKKYEFNKENNINTICVKAAMGVGKTKNLKELINKYNKIVIVSFRVTLDKAYVKQFNDFVLYSDIKDSKYDTLENNKMVIQIDSLHRLTGPVDLLILDEITYTMMHLVERAKYREGSYNALQEYIKDKSVKIIAMDALMDIDILNWFFMCKRKIHYIENQYEKHKDKKVINYKFNIGNFTESIINNLKNNNKIILATNYKGFIEHLKVIIKEKIGYINGRFLTADNSDDIDIENWDKYDIVAYTPTIVAGISYENLHFDKCYGFFINTSAPAEMSLQQLFRVRNLTDNEIHICFENRDNTVYPINDEDINSYIINRSNCLIDGVMGVKIKRKNNKIIQDLYYHLYKNVQKRLFISKNNYEDILIKLFNKQGINDIITINDNDFLKDKEIRKGMAQTVKEISETLIEDILNADEINQDTAEYLQKKLYLTYEEKNQLKKYTFRNVYRYNDDINKELFKKYWKKYKYYKNINIYYSFENKILEYLNVMLENKEIQKINKTKMIEEDNTTCNNISILHDNKKYEKFLIALDIVRNIGFDSILDNKDIELDVSKMYKYINEKQHIINLTYNSKSIDISNIIDENEKRKKMLIYLNSKLKSVFNIYISLKDRKNNKYIIKGLELWNEKINPLYRNDELIDKYEMEIFISNILNLE
jgi:hypothetical protein